MSTRISIHFVKTMAAEEYNGTTWLAISDKEENSLAIFMPYRQAEMIANAFAEYENWESSQEGPTFDEADRQKVLVGAATKLREVK
jgi:hypothetical protein